MIIKTFYRMNINAYFQAVNCRFHNTGIKKTTMPIPPHPSLHWQKVLVVVTHFFFVRKGHKYIFFILYYSYTLVLTSRLIK